MSIQAINVRNQFKGKVREIIRGDVVSEVDVETPWGIVTSVITTRSVDELQLKIGSDVVALVKAPWVMLMTDAEGIRLSARNCLAGTVKSVADGAVNAEVVLDLGGGSEVVAVVTRDAVAELGLAAGVKATAVIKASHVILGVPS